MVSFLALDNYIVLDIMKIYQSAKFSAEKKIPHMSKFSAKLKWQPCFELSPKSTHIPHFDMFSTLCHRHDCFHSLSEQKTSFHIIFNTFTQHFLDPDGSTTCIVSILFVAKIINNRIALSAIAFNSVNINFVLFSTFVVTLDPITNVPSCCVIKFNQYNSHLAQANTMCIVILNLATSNVVNNCKYFCIAILPYDRPAIIWKQNWHLVVVMIV